MTGKPSPFRTASVKALLPTGDPHTGGRASRLNPTLRKALTRESVQVHTADALAVAVGKHPIEIWPDFDRYRLGANA